MIKNRMNRHTNSPQKPGGGGAQVSKPPEDVHGLTGEAAHRDLTRTSNLGRTGTTLRSYTAGVLKEPLLRGVSAVEGLRMWLLDQIWFQSRLLPALPRQVRWILRKAYLAPVDLADRLLDRGEPELPPKAQRFTGGVRDFAASGKLLREALSSAAGLTSSSHVLDVGCGIGRFAVAMPGFLDGSGAFVGLDIVREGIAWCEKHIVSPQDNVHFTFADVFNKEYNPKGRVQAADYRFPYEDQTFDVVVLVSVFTHMLPVDFDQYVGEIARVLKKNGRIFATYFVITPESLKLMNSGSGSVRFKHNLGSHWIQSSRVPELGVAYDERYLREVYARHGLSDPPDIYLGQWCGRAGCWPPDSGLLDQDTVVATKL
jgi:SAM-dependent methyltransferase